MLQVWPWQESAYAATAPPEQRRFIRVEPAVFQPSQGESTRIRWNWEQDHPTVIKLMSGGQIAAIIQEERNYAGGYVTHEFVWNGRDSGGSLVPEGTYDILIEPQDKYKGYGSQHPVTVLGQGGADIAISPKATGDRFLVYGQKGRSHGVSTVKLNITANGVQRTLDAKVEDSRWWAEVGITPYTQTKIEAELAGAGSGKPSLTVTNHRYRIFDNMRQLALAYFGDDRRQSDIAKDNHLTSVIDEDTLVGTNILVINPANEIRIPQQEPVLGGNMGVVDMLSGTNTNTPAHMGMGNNLGITSDIYIGGSFPLFFTRTYNSRDDYFSALGLAWSHTFSERLRDLDRAVLIRFEDGHIERYDKQQDGTYRAGKGVYHELSRQADGQFVLVTKDRNKLYFDTKGLPVMYENEQGVALRLSYSDGRLSRADREGNSLTFSYDAQGKLVGLSDQSGRKISYTYEGRALSGMTDVEGAEYRYVYDAEGRITQVNGPDHITLRSMAYDNKGRLTSIRYADGYSQTYSYDEEKGTVTLKEGTGLTTTYHYDDQLRLIKIVDSKGEQTFRYPDGGAAGTSAADSPSYETVAQMESMTAKSSADSGVVMLASAETATTSFMKLLASSNTARQVGSATCSADTWDAKKVYVAGDYAAYQGKTWMAKWWTLGEAPRGTDWDVWKEVSECGDTSNGGGNHNGNDSGNGNTEPSPQNCNAAAWDIKKVYVNGDHATYNGSMWRAKWWTLGEVPGNGDEWSVWKKVTSCTGDQGGDNNPNPPDPAYDEAIMAPDTGSNPLRVEMYNQNRAEKYNTLYPWYRLHNISDAPITVSDIRIRYFFTADSKDRLMFWGDWSSIGGNYRVNGSFTRLKQPGMNVDTVLEISFDEGAGVIEPGASLDLHTRISKDRWIEFTQTNDYSFNAQDTDFADWDRIAVFVGSQWVWGSMPNAAAIEVGPPSSDSEMKIPVFHSKESFVESKDANGSRTSYVLDHRGNVKQVTDGLGHVTKFDYDTVGRVTSVTDALGNKTTYSYDAHGNMLTMTDAEGHKTEYTYNAKGLPTAISAPDGSKLTVSYDGNGNPSEIKDGTGASYKRNYDALNRLVEAADPTGGKYRYAYSPSGRVEKITDALGQSTQVIYNARGEQEQLIDAAGGKTLYRYNGNGQLDSVVDPLGYATKYIYDANGRTEQIVAPDGGITRYSYDQYSRISSITDAEGGKTSYQYDAMDNLISETDARGNSTRYSYDVIGRMTEFKMADGAVTKLSYDAIGRVEQQIDAAGSITRFKYDGNSRLLQEIDALGQTVHYAYTPNGQIASITDAAGGVTSYEYDGNGRLIAVMDALKHRTTYNYDPSGRMIEETNSLGQKTKYSYDAKGQLLTITDIGGQVTRFAYTSLGQLASQTDPLNHTTIYDYDASGQLTEVRDAQGNKTRYSYDASGNRIAQVRYGANQEQQTMKYAYDKLGRRIEETNPLGLQTRYVYDQLDNLLTITHPDGKVTKHTYDTQNRLTEIVYDHDQRASFTYDKLGGLVSLKDWNGDTQVKRDQLGQIISVTDPKGRTVNYTWTPTGLKDTLTTPDGQKVAYSYDAMQRLTTVEDKAGITRYTYNAVGQVAEKKSANGSNTTYEYNNMGRLQQSNERNRAGEVINQHTYRYDDAGNILSWIEKIGGQTRDKQYTYDELNQLIQVIDNGQMNKYRYDSFGNRISKSTGSSETTYTYNAANQLQQEKTGALSKNYQYDKRGNLISVQGGQEQETYTYDAANYLVGVVRNGKSLEYRYNAQGVRIQSKDVSASTTQDFLVDMTSAYNDLLSVYEGNELIESYSYGLNRLHVYLSDGTNETYSYDHLGSIVGLQDGQGKLKDTYRYDEFGVLDKSTQPSDRLAVNFGYTGYPNEGNGLYFAQARYYNPEIGRFVSEDTYEGSISNPLSLNWYVYVENNPLRYVDPSGHFKFEPYDIQELRDVLKQISEKDLSKEDEYYQVSKDFIWNHYNFKSFMDENQYNYLFGLLTGTSAYTNNTGRASWAREQLIDAYYESKEAEYVALLAMAMAGANMPGSKGTGTKSAAKKTTTKGTGQAFGKINPTNIPNMSKKEILNGLPKGWTYTENNGFVHVRDANGTIRMRIDPPDKVTKYDHVHLYDGNKNPLDINGNIVNPKSPDAHIPYKK
ncbi:RHS repeat-associated core domain-containing protein [Paenibacillus lentus]